MKDSATFEATSGEFNALLLESVIAGAALQVALPSLGSTLGLGSAAIWFGIGFFALFLCLYPALSVVARSKGDTQISLVRFMLFSAVGAVIGASIFALLS